MKRDTNLERSHERAIAGLLRWGTWLASTVIAMGMALSLVDHSASAPLGLDWREIAGLGIGLFILLPILRVGLMLLLFLRERDSAYACIAAAVLAIILASSLTGLLWS
ncbi:MAG: DUF1634 domain-containing protein [Burkholderiaceae bacterium]